MTREPILSKDQASARGRPPGPHTLPYVIPHDPVPCRFHRAPARQGATPRPLVPAISIALQFYNQDAGTDRNFSVTANSWTYIGYSGSASYNVEDILFTNATGNVTNWSGAIETGKVQAYIGYHDSLNTTATERKSKYITTSASSQGLSADGYAMEPGVGYWLMTNENGDINFTGVGGATTNQTFSWHDLKFGNGSDVVNVTTAGDEGWIKDTFQYYDGDYKDINPSGDPDTKDYISPWENFLVYSYQDNITIIRQNW